MIVRAKSGIVAQSPRRRHDTDALSLVSSTATGEYVRGPSCIPLVSNDIRFNPYHPQLLSRPGAEVRCGLGRPVRIHGVASVDCTGKKHSCGLKIERGSTATATNTLTVSISRSSSESFALGDTRSEGQSNAITRSIARGTENSVTDTSSISSEHSLSRSLSESLASTLRKSSSLSKSRGSERQRGDSRELRHPRTKPEDGEECRI